MVQIIQHIKLYQNVVSYTELCYVTGTAMHQNITYCPIFCYIGAELARLADILSERIRAQHYMLQRFTSTALHMIFYCAALRCAIPHQTALCCAMVDCATPSLLHASY